MSRELDEDVDRVVADHGRHFLGRLVVDLPPRVRVALEHVGLGVAAGDVGVADHERLVAVGVGQRRSDEVGDGVGEEISAHVADAQGSIERLGVRPAEVARARVLRRERLSPRAVRLPHLEGGRVRCSRIGLGTVGDGRVQSNVAAHRVERQQTILTGVAGGRIDGQTLRVRADGLFDAALIAIQHLQSEQHKKMTNLQTLIRQQQPTAVLAAPLQSPLPLHCLQERPTPRLLCASA